MVQLMDLSPEMLERIASFIVAVQQPFDKIMRLRLLSHEFSAALLPAVFRDLDCMGTTRRGGPYHPSFAQMATVASQTQLSHLCQSLTVRTPLYADTTPFCLTAISAFPRIQSLTLRTFDDSGYPLATHIYVTLPHLTVLRLEYDDAAECSSVIRRIQACSPNLHRVEMRTYFYALGEDRTPIEIDSLATVWEGGGSGAASFFATNPCRPKELSLDIPYVEKKHWYDLVAMWAPQRLSAFLLSPVLARVTRLDLIARADAHNEVYTSLRDGLRHISDIKVNVVPYAG